MSVGPLFKEVIRMSRKLKRILSILISIFFVYLLFILYDLYNRNKSTASLIYTENYVPEKMELYSGSWGMGPEISLQEQGVVEIRGRSPVNREEAIKRIIPSCNQ